MPPVQVAAFIAIFLPLWESRDVFMRVLGLSGPRTQDTTLPTTDKPGKEFVGAKPYDDTAHGAPI